MSYENNLHLELVQVICRHGARTYHENEISYISGNVESYHQNFTDTYGYNQLTNHGKRQMHNLGRALRDRYNEFLGEAYSTNYVHVQSSNAQHTQVSLLLLLAGLFPPAPQQVWNSNLKWLPIPYHYEPLASDILLQPYIKADYHRILSEAIKLVGIKEKVLTLRKCYENLINEGILVNMKTKNVVFVFGIFNYLRILKEENLSLPDWYTDALYETVSSFAHEILNLMSVTTETKKLNGGPLIKKFVENIKLNNQNKNSKKMYLYTAHEFTLAGFIKAHNLEGIDYPDFSTAVILEKLRDSQNKSLYVRFIGWNGKKFKVLKIKNYEELCPIDKYLKSVEHIIPSDEEINSLTNCEIKHYMSVFEYVPVKN